MIGSAGTVDIGAIDDLRALGALCREQGLWFHVDGAYGALGVLAPALAPRLAGLETGEDIRAREKLTLASQIVPGEPAALADLALLDVRQQEFDAAADYAEKARVLAPDEPALTIEVPAARAAR